MRHTAKHALPLGNHSGHGQVVDGITNWTLTVWCGYCKGSYEPDQHWVDAKLSRGYVFSESESSALLAVGLTCPEPVQQVVRVGPKQLAYQWSGYFPLSVGDRVLLPGNWLTDYANFEADVVGFGTDHDGSLHSVERCTVRQGVKK